MTTPHNDDDASDRESPAATASDESAPAAKYFGRYEELHELASGGMGTVCIGRLLGPGGFKRHVAIKTIHPHLSKNEEYAQMFTREAGVASRLEHPNVIPVLEFGSERGQLYQVMEYYPSVSLADLARTLRDRGESMPLLHAVEFVMDAAAGLEAAHNMTTDDGQSLEVVHRDASPANLLVGIDGTVRVTDFGLAKAQATVMGSITTNTKIVKGKLSYLSPEQATCDPLDRRSDVFTLGVVLHELITGQKLFQGENEFSLVRAIVALPIPSPQELRADCPEALADVVLRALRRHPPDRYQSAAELRDALHAVARTLPDPGPRGALVDRLMGHVFAFRRRAVARVEMRRDHPSVPPLPLTVPPDPIDAGAILEMSGSALVAESSVPSLTSPALRLAPTIAPPPVSSPDIRPVVPDLSPVTPLDDSPAPDVSAATPTATPSVAPPVSSPSVAPPAAAPPPVLRVSRTLAVAVALFAAAIVFAVIHATEDTDASTIANDPPPPVEQPVEQPVAAPTPAPPVVAAPTPAPPVLAAPPAAPPVAPPPAAPLIVPPPAAPTLVAEPPASAASPRRPNALSDNAPQRGDRRAHTPPDATTSPPPAANAPTTPTPAPDPERLEM